MQTVAALFVQRGGVYWDLDDVDPWDEARDARKYAGPWPVVAHPPCARWCALASANEALYGYSVGDDQGTFASALGAVRKYGGVLEHPAQTLAWRNFGLRKPSRHGWTQDMISGEWSCEVSQRAYGCPAQKLTWLLCVSDTPPPSLDWSRPRPIMRIGAKALPGMGRLRAPHSSATPIPFRDILLAIARGARK